MSEMVEVKVPDIGDFDSVEIIEILVSVGDQIAEEDSLITVESDKASMEIPSSHTGTVKEIKVNIGESIAEGGVVVVVETSASSAPVVEEPAKQEAPVVAAKVEEAAKPVSAPATAPAVRPSPTANIDPVSFKNAHASPAVRKFARELGVDLGKIGGTGRNERIVKEDVQAFVKQVMSTGGASVNGGAALGVEAMPEIDFSQFGEVEIKPLSKINKLTGKFLHRNWVTIPHVTQFDEADITSLEAFRKQSNKEYEREGVKFTMLSFIMKAVAAGLKKYPRFNSSLEPSGENLILKNYFNIGVAVDTPDGLVVPVIRDVDKKSLVEISMELRELSVKARDKKLKPSDMQGGCMSISSLGGIGGTNFTPIVNAPEVAILGVSRASMKPVWNGSEFEPKLMCPLSLSYDHRVVDGADGARFITYVSSLLADARRLLL
ncbi:MAG: dihydrolipoyllysine-residue acetyltransferase [endosymbiont of Galathealinum brachiosum]|uniref:Acetyltransferase component of pyruvate dehydrogenase complex n=1 Tax=endosymbiont of Galathealinum brachiosum TaxID=2200906 RepID=A0A370DJX3_9GAMM|nr:MAG: dihydrolipoyllysine-residue acetyltransferase [endosymbiont of Galathealinum brachiosum]